MDREKPIVDMLTLRRDLYFVMSLLLADKTVTQVKNATAWTQVFHENEVRRLILWVTVAIRGLLDLSEDGNIGNQICGEYWPDFINEENSDDLTVRQACNSVIHAKEIFTYRIDRKEILTYNDWEQKENNIKKRIYDGRITVNGIHKKKQTHAHLDIIKFAQTANTLINTFEENEHAYD